MRAGRRPRCPRRPAGRMAPTSAGSASSELPRSSRPLSDRAKAITPGITKMKIGRTFRYPAKTVPRRAWSMSRAARVRCTMTWSVHQYHTARMGEVPGRRVVFLLLPVRPQRDGEHGHEVGDDDPVDQRQSAHGPPSPLPPRDDGASPPRTRLRPVTRDTISTNTTGRNQWDSPVVTCGWAHHLSHTAGPCSGRRRWPAAPPVPRRRSTTRVG